MGLTARTALRSKPSGVLAASIPVNMASGIYEHQQSICLWTRLRAVPSSSVDAIVGHEASSS
ncbi:hypothetical protein, partial [Paraburkholderia sp. SIMBA_054]|uniref:hypothetical protein n=1 Tax=Paraburkholderia sp. SIMBA_054 TaxID=3085795 RepID=UPI00397B61EF